MYAQVRVSEVPRSKCGHMRWKYEVNSGLMCYISNVTLPSLYNLPNLLFFEQRLYVTMNDDGTHIMTLALIKVTTVILLIYD